MSGSIAGTYSTAELAVIGSLVMYPDKVADAYARLTPEMFESEELAALFRECAALGQNIDVPLLVAKAGDERRELIYECVDSIVNYAGVEKYVELVRDNWRKREMLRELSELADELLSPGIQARDVLGVMIQIADRQIALERSDREESVKDFCNSAADYVESLSRKDDAIHTGFQILDWITGGLRRGGVYVISARSGKGKSDFAINLATNIAREQGVFYATMEMPHNQIIERIISRMAHLDSTRLRDHNITQQERDSIISISSRLTKELRLNIDDQPGLTVEQIESKIIRHRPDVFFIDHIGLMNHRAGKKQYWEALKETTGRLKSLAMKYNIVLVELVQQNRTSDTRKGSPTMSELKGGGSIEEDADGVFIIESRHNGEMIVGEGRIEATVHIMKNRHGATGKAEFKWQPQYHSWAAVM